MPPISAALSRSSHQLCHPSPPPSPDPATNSATHLHQQCLTYKNCPREAKATVRAMDLATAALRSLLPKLAELIHGEYKLQKGVKKDVQFLEREMTSIDAALRKVAMVPHDKLDDNSKIWANQVRELSYEMEDVVESFLVGVQGFEPAANPDGFKGFVKKVANLFTKGKARHQIANAIKSIKDQVQEVADRRDRYKIDDLQASLAATTMVDPRLMAQFKDHKEFVGIEGPRDELIKRLVDEDDCESKQQLKILSIFGFGGVGKTTLARAVYDKIQAQFVCKAFFGGSKSQPEECSHRYSPPT